MMAPPQMLCPSCEAANAAAAASCIACGQSLVEQPGAPRPGALFAGRYQILAVLGRGGMGMVYQAKDTRLEETVALKVIRPDLARESRLHERFRSEIKLARRVRHKNVCSIFGDGEEQGILWICMELVDGLDLRRLLRTTGALPRQEAYEIAIQIAEGLQAMHDEGVIHRDLKTANVMRDSRGVVRLMDFGLAKQSRAEESAGPTASGHVVGTPDYMSPEQARGEKLTFASDLYALGVIGFELFTGEPPFRGDTPLTTLFKHLNDPPPFEGDLGRRLPRALVPVLRKALAKRPGDRFASAAEMLLALRAAQKEADDASATPLRVPLASEGTPTLDAAAPTHRSELTEDMSVARPALPPARPPRTSSFSQPLTARRWGGVWFLVPLGVVAMVIVTAPLLRNSRLPSPSPAAVGAVVAPPATTLTYPLMSTTTLPRDAAAAAAPAAKPMSSASSRPDAPPKAWTDSAGTVLQHHPVRCLLEGQFPLLEAKVLAAVVNNPRVYFKSALSEGYYYVEMTRAGETLRGKLPKPKLVASPVSYYFAVETRERAVRTPEFQSVVVGSPAACPAGGRVAEIGPPGSVQVFSATLEWMWLRDALSLDALVGQLSDPDPSVREAAADALRTVSPSVKSVLDKALVKLRDPDARVREAGADDIDGVSDVIVKEAMLPLIAALRDKHKSVRLQAAASLGEIGPPIAAAARALRATLRDPEPQVRKAAMEALATIGSVVGQTLTVLKDAPGRDGDADLVRATQRAYDLIEKAGR
jgi:serine/threonine-protein kinase